MAAIPTLAQLAAMVAGLQANMASMANTISLQNVTITALQKAQGITWRLPQITATTPPTGPARVGSIPWARANGLAASAPVWLSMDGSARVLLKQNPIIWSAKPGEHIVNFFLSASGGTPELSCEWIVTES